MSSSSLLTSPSQVKKWPPVCPGYLDGVLTVFERHHHPFVLVSTMAMRWHGANNMPMQEIDVLVRSSHLQAIVDDLVASNKWNLSQNYADDQWYASLINNTPIRDVWLKSSGDLILPYLRFWPEELYQLSVNCNKIEIADVWTTRPVLMEEEYYRDPYERFGPNRRSCIEQPGRPLILGPKFRARLERQDIPIFTPTIEEHLNALLAQETKELETRLMCGNAPETQVGYFIRSLYLEWAPTQKWILETKILERNRELMAKMLNKYRRKLIILWDNVLNKHVFDKMPWELTIRPEFQI